MVLRQLLGIFHVRLVKQVSIRISMVPVLVVHVLSVLLLAVGPIGVRLVITESMPLRRGCQHARVVTPANTSPRPARPPRHNAKTVRLECICRTPARKHVYYAEEVNMLIQLVCQYAVPAWLANRQELVLQYVPSAHLANMLIQAARPCAANAIRANMQVQLLCQHALSVALMHILQQAV